MHWCSSAPEGTAVIWKKPGRTIPQNDRMWAMLTDVASQVEHNGKRWTADQWKQLFMNACGYEAHFMPGLNGEPFPAGFRSSKLNKEQMTELMDFIDAWGTQNGVKWSEPVGGET
jgi:NinB protein